jgi:non-ribosomal peptide synthetase-like protein
VCLTSGSANLYIAILGVLMAGAAYVPIDIDDPPARTTDIVSRSGAQAVIRDGLEIEVLASNRGHGAPHDGPHAPSRPSEPPQPEDDAWIIFTSGSTGAPKGVAVSHRSAAAFVDAEAEVFRVTGRDRVLAGLSIAFDASCEEIWLAWRNGAALVPAPRHIVRAGVELGDWLAQHDITIVSTVPSLAALWDVTCLASVRMLILGGEECPDPLAARLAPGREVWNTYGPTEACVVSTFAPILAGQPVRIGKPLAGWEVAVVDGDEVVPTGTPGELLIAGVGLARYLDPQLDAQRFVPFPALGWDRAYRTGDIVVETSTGLDFLGRRDHQVKIAGRRIELGEIEASLVACPGVQAAAATIQESASGNQLLVGYVVGPVDAVQVRMTLADCLPAGLVPLVVVLSELPLSSAGKLDRAELPWPVDQAVGPDSVRAPLSEAQRRLADLWVEQLGPSAINASSNFFSLGGASLAAAKLVSVLRRSWPGVAVADIYRFPTLSALADRLGELGEVDRSQLSQPTVAPLRRWFGPAQIAGVIGLLAIRSIPWALAAFAWGDVFGGGTPHVAWIWLILGFGVLGSRPGRLAVLICASRLLTRGVAPGRYRRDSWLAWRLWFLCSLSEICGSDRVGGSPFAARYARLLGAQVAAGARLGTVPSAGALLTIGADATLEGHVDLRGWYVDGADLVIGAITIGSGASVGPRAYLHPGTVIEDGAEIEPGSVISGRVPGGERWGGSPACRTGVAGDDWPAEMIPRSGGEAHSRRWLFAVSLLFEDVLLVAAAVPGLLVLWQLGGFVPTLHSAPGLTMLEALVDVVLWIPTYAVLHALTLRVLWRPLRPGCHRDDSLVAWSLWLGEDLHQRAGASLFALYASLFTRNWLRLMGVAVGERCEISTCSGLNPLVFFDELCQCTDDVSFCGVRARNGWIVIRPIVLGAGAFLGPGAIIPGGSSLGAGSLIGVMTTAPEHVEPDSSWLGIPALELPRIPDRGDPARTVAPPARLRFGRATMDLARLFVPNLLGVSVALLELFVLASIAQVAGALAAVIASPLILFAGGVVASAMVVLAKWALIGRYRPGRHPLWSWFVWRDEFINACQEVLAVGHLLGFALGTPLMGMYLRAMGARVEADVWIETTAVTEYDVLELRRGAVANRESCLMTHLFHDRLLRIGPSLLMPGATIGPHGAVLPDTILGTQTHIGPRSVLLRGEELPDRSRWHGTPVVPA